MCLLSGTRKKNSWHITASRRSLKFVHFPCVCQGKNHHSQRLYLSFDPPLVQLQLFGVSCLICLRGRSSSIPVYAISVAASWPRAKELYAFSYRNKCVSIAFLKKQPVFLRGQGNQDHSTFSKNAFGTRQYKNYQNF